jgi:serine protease Do
MMVFMGLLMTMQTEARLPDFTDLVDQVSPAVVKINVTFKASERQAMRAYPRQMPEALRELLQQQQRNQRDRPKGYSMGSGFVISEDGYILTNHHVVNDADEIRVSFADRREFQATVVGSDKRSDLALLKIEVDNLQTLTFADQGALRVGAWVLAIGSPFGLDYSVTAGIVSAIGRSIPSEDSSTYVPFIQTDVAINPGNSGGPLFDLKGNVVGINSQIYSRSGGSIGLSFAIPASVALNVVAQLKETGRVDRGWLGVSIQDVSQKLAKSLDLGDAQGALINSVSPDSPAEKGGIMPGDVITRFNRQKVVESSDLPPLVGQVPPGESVPVEIVREGSKQELDITVAVLDGDSGSGGNAASPDDFGDRLGLVVESLSNSQLSQLRSRGGVLVSEVLPQSPAFKAGLSRADVIVQLGQVSVVSLEGYRALLPQLPENRPIAIRFLRQGRAVFRTIQIDAE